MYLVISRLLAAAVHQSARRAASIGSRKSINKTPQAAISAPDFVYSSANVKGRYGTRDTRLYAQQLVQRCHAVAADEGLPRRLWKARQLAVLHQELAHPAAHPGAFKGGLRA